MLFSSRSCAPRLDGRAVLRGRLPLRQGSGEFLVGYRFLTTSSTARLINFDTDGPDGTLKTRLNLNSVNLDYSSREYSLGKLWDMKWLIGAQLGQAYFDSRAVGTFVEQRVSNNFVGAGPHAGRPAPHRARPVPVRPHRGDRCWAASTRGLRKSSRIIPCPCSSRPTQRANHPLHDDWRCHTGSGVPDDSRPPPASRHRAGRPPWTRTTFALPWVTSSTRRGSSARCRTPPLISSWMAFSCGPSTATSAIRLR